MNVLVTGGAGYIGSHTVVELIEAGYTPIIVDDFSNAREDVIDRIEKITSVRPVFYRANCTDKQAMREIFEAQKIDAVIHFAAFKAVGESVRKPLQYYRNIPDYKDVTTSKLDRVCYRILGKWVSSTGIVMEFREDGTCTLDGKDYYFYARNFALETGTSPDNLKGGWTIHSCNGKTMSLENTRNHKQYRLTKEAQ